MRRRGKRSRAVRGAAPAPRPRRARIRPGQWLLRHAQVLVASLGRISRQPLGALMTTTVIAVAVALPAGLHLLVGQVQALASAWEGGSSISLFLEPGIAEPEAAALAERLRARDDIASVQVISAAQALAEFREQSGFGEALDLLAENPLPAVLLVRPGPVRAEPSEAARLAEELGGLGAVDIARADLQWLQRLQAITRIAERGITVLTLLLAAAVLLVIGNTIRLEIQNRRHEIEISKLVGATDAFIRRPFLYEGLWYGLFGALLAGLLVGLSILALHEPVARLAGLYQGRFELGRGMAGTLAVLLLGTPLLGLLGAWLAVARQLRRADPE